MQAFAAQQAAQSKGFPMGPCHEPLLDSGGSVPWAPILLCIWYAVRIGVQIRGPSSRPMVWIVDTKERKVARRPDWNQGGGASKPRVWRRINQGPGHLQCLPRGCVRGGRGVGEVAETVRQSRPSTWTSKARIPSVLAQRALLSSP